ncbi:hypothetical protein SCLCIDRAFT_711556 [Scleroderma citrinum Foug A]|uniref:Uncharacterized protein n=1 Tax=Scleroderma citrinum Foug A TaxID=1036808 RepID=A0A0C3EMW4_9AGAM|nr:hypothetical protein SCLCIDRAFT_711556 [Scleroderma citrinum Foug A]
MYLCLGPSCGICREKSDRIHGIVFIRMSWTETPAIDTRAPTWNLTGRTQRPRFGFDTAVDHLPWVKLASSERFNCSLSIPLSYFPSQIYIYIEGLKVGFRTRLYSFGMPI